MVPTMVVMVCDGLMCVVCDGGVVVIKTVSERVKVGKAWKHIHTTLQHHSTTQHSIDDGSGGDRVVVLT
jgi:hypothetical protein